MTRGYTYIMAAFAAAGALFWVFAVGFSVAALNYPQQERYQGYLDPGSSNAAQYHVPCRELNGREESDLCAQWKAARAGEAGAEWAKWSFWVGLTSAVLSAVGLTALLVSLRQTEISLSEARKSNLIAEDSSARDLRAYVGITVATIKGIDNYVTEIVFSVTNFGKTPALDVIKSFKSGYFPNIPKEYGLFAEIENLGILEPGEDRNVIYRILPPMTRQQIHQFSKIGHELFAVLCLDYKDHKGVSRSRIGVYHLNTQFDPGVGEEWQMECIRADTDERMQIAN